MNNGWGLEIKKVEIHNKL